MSETAAISASVSSASVSSAVAAASSALSEAAKASASAASVIAAAAGQTEQPPVFKVIGVILAVASGFFIGTSFVFKKKGLLASQAKAGSVAGEGHAYLKSPMWWTGMIIMIVGEIFNFVAYAFAPALLVTPLGALSVVVCAVLSHFFLKERLTFFGKLGCVLCILGSTIVALNGPEEGSVTTILAFQSLFLSPGFLVFGSVVILASLGLIFFVAPKYGKSNMLVYIGVCSLIGGLSVSCTQGLGSSILTSIRGDNQFKHWFIYFLLGFVIITLLIEINYLNKALELFNTSMVTPTYFVTFTGATLVTSVILYQGLHASAVQIVTVVFGFFVTCCGITILQMSKVDPKELKIDRRSTILLSAAKTDVDDEKGLSAEDPGIDALRGGFGAVGSIYRARSARNSVANIARRRSQAHSMRSTQSSGGHSSPGVELKRHQLYDQPMPSNAISQVMLHSPGGDHPTSPPALSEIALTPTQSRQSRHIGFAENVVEHRYGTGKAPAGTAQHVDHQPSVDGPSRLRFGGGPIPASGLPSHPKDLRLDTSMGMSNSDAGTATIVSPSRQTWREYADPYSQTLRPDTSQNMAALQSLNGKMQRFATPPPDLHLSDPRSRERTTPINSSSHGVSGLFSPRRQAQAQADAEETVGLVERHSNMRESQDEYPTRAHDRRHDSSSTLASRSSDDLS